MSMSLGDFLSKVITAPIKIAVMPIKTISALMEDDYDDALKSVTKSIEEQVKDIVD
jgi:hypothetical protein